MQANSGSFQVETFKPQLNQLNRAPVAALGPRPGPPEPCFDPIGPLLLLGLFVLVSSVAAAVEAVGLLGSCGGCRGWAEAGAVDPAPRPAAAAPGARPGAITALALRGAYIYDII